MQKTMLSIFAAVALSATGCGDTDRVEDHNDRSGHQEPDTESAGDRAAAAAAERHEANGAEPGSRIVSENVARRRADLATDVGADPEEMVDEPARTAAGHIAAGDEDLYAE